MYNVFRQYQDGTKQFLGQVDCPTEIMDVLRPNNRRNRSFLIIQPII